LTRNRLCAGVSTTLSHPSGPPSPLITFVSHSRVRVCDPHFSGNVELSSTGVGHRHMKRFASMHKTCSSATLFNDCGVSCVRFATCRPTAAAAQKRGGESGDVSLGPPDPRPLPGYSNLDPYLGTNCSRSTQLVFKRWRLQVPPFSTSSPRATRKTATS
jgi:hypothetical protein